MTNEIQNAQMENATAVVDPTVLDEFQGMMDSAASAMRDPSVPEGTPIGSTDIGGMPMNLNKPSSMHHINGQALPERMPLYQWPNNEVSMIPTARIFNRLARTDGDGHRVWSREPFPDATPIQYIEREVPLLEGGTMVKRFASVAAYEAFMRNKHGDTWAAQLRDEERAERQADRAAQEELGRALLAAAGGNTERVAVSAESPTIPTSLIDHLDPAGLKALADEFDIKLSDRRSHEKMRAELRAALEPSE